MCYYLNVQFQGQRVNKTGGQQLQSTSKWRGFLILRDRQLCERTEFRNRRTIEYSEHREFIVSFTCQIIPQMQS